MIYLNITPWSTDLSAANVSAVAVTPTVTEVLSSPEYYDYDYDFQDSVSTIPLSELIPVALVYGLTLVLGVTGNALVIFSILRYRRMQSVTNIFLTSLATADLLLVLLCVPIKFAKWFSFTWAFGEALCKLVHYMQNVSVLCSIFTLTAISLERYYAILYPMKARYMCTLQRAKRLIVFIWVLSVTSALPIIFGQIHKEVGVARKGYWCVKEWPVQWYSQVYECAMLAFVFVIPLAIMGFAYVSISMEMWRISSDRVELRANSYECNHVRNGRFVDVSGSQQLPGPNRHSCAVTVRDDMGTRKQVQCGVIKMLVAIIIIFAVCWGPSLIDNVLVAFELVEALNYSHLKPMRQVFALLTYLNSCANPIVYAFMSRNFRQCFHTALRSLIRKRPAWRGPERQDSFPSALTRRVSHTASSVTSIRPKPGAKYGPMVKPLAEPGDPVDPANGGPTYVLGYRFVQVDEDV